MFKDIQIKLIMITNYENQLNVLYDKFYCGELCATDFITNINYFNHRCQFTRIDIKNYGKQNDIQFFEYDKNITLSSPTWLKDDFGQGYKLEWKQENTGFIVKCLNDGNLKIILRGIDFRDINGNRIPIYTNFTKLTINDEIIFDDNHLIWHNNPYIFEKNCNDEQYFQVSLEFKTLYDYFPQLNSQKLVFEDINNSYQKLINLIKLEKLLLEKQIRLSDSNE